MNSVVKRNVVFVREILEFQLLSNGDGRNSNSAHNDLRALFPSRGSHGCQAAHGGCAQPIELNPNM
jgi:hypothetical protein